MRQIDTQSCAFPFQIPKVFIRRFQFSLPRELLLTHSSHPLFNARRRGYSSVQEEINFKRPTSQTPLSLFGDRQTGTLPGGDFSTLLGQACPKIARAYRPAAKWGRFFYRKAYNHSKVVYSRPKRHRGPIPDGHLLIFPC